MISAKSFIKENSKIFSSQIGHYNFFYPDKEKVSFTNLKKEVIVLSTWICPSGLAPFYFVGEEVRVVYWTEKENILRIVNNE